jgi:hypothetical protein
VPKTPDHLSEESAQRLLARAAELDVYGVPNVSVDQLRRAALEAGISETAFDRALQETSPSGRPSPAKYLRALLAPAAAVGTFWFSLSVLARAALYMGAGWHVRGLANVVALAIGVAVGASAPDGLLLSSLVSRPVKGLSGWLMPSGASTAPKERRSTGSRSEPGSEAPSSQPCAPSSAALIFLKPRLRPRQLRTFDQARRPCPPLGLFRRERNNGR